MRWRLVPEDPTQEMVRAAYQAQPDAINAGFAQAYRDMLAAAPASPHSSAATGEQWNPTDEQVRSACKWYRHDLDLLTVSEAAEIKTEARLWLRAWQKEVADLLRDVPQSAPEQLAKIRHRGVFIERQLQEGGVYRFICHTGINKFLPDLYDTQELAIKAVDAKLDASTLPRPQSETGK